MTILGELIAGIVKAFAEMSPSDMQSPDAQLQMVMQINRRLADAEMRLKIQLNRGRDK